MLARSGGLSLGYSYRGKRNVAKTAQKIKRHGKVYNKGGRGTWICDRGGKGRLCICVNGSVISAEQSLITLHFPIFVIDSDHSVICLSWL